MTTELTKELFREGAITRYMVGVIILKRYTRRAALSRSSGEKRRMLTLIYDVRLGD